MENSTNILEQIETQLKPIASDLFDGQKDYSELSSCNALSEIPAGFFDESDCSTLMSLSSMNKDQVKFCFDKDLFNTYPMIGMAAVIDKEIKPCFMKLGCKKDSTL